MSRLREIDEMRFLAIGAAFELPHDHKALALLARAFEIVGKVEKALQEPGLLIEPVVGQDRLLGARALRRQAPQKMRSHQQISPSDHGAHSVNHAGKLALAGRRDATYIYSLYWTRVKIG